MGRSVKRDIEGKLVFGTAEGAAAGIRISAYVPGGSSAAPGFIIKQSGARSYKISTSQGTGKCKLVETVTGPGQAVMSGEADSGTIAIAKLLKRTAIDFEGNRYTWKLVNDSSVDYIELTAI